MERGFPKEPACTGACGVWECERGARARARNCVSQIAIKCKTVKLNEKEASPGNIGAMDSTVPSTGNLSPKFQ